MPEEQKKLPTYGAEFVRCPSSAIGKEVALMHPEKKLWLHFLPVLTAAVVITLLSMITSVGIPYITDSFGLTSRQAPWINTAGTMASAVLAPLLGWTGDRCGIRAQLLIGIFCAVVSNLICAFTGTFLLFCFGRFLGGIGLAAALPAAMKYISLQFPEEKKVGGFAVLAACICLGSGLGPAVVGLALSKIAWRSLFLLSEIPLALLGLCVWLTVSGPYGEPRRSKPDAAGMTLLFFGVGALLALLTLTTQYSWNGILLPALLAVSLICLVCFYRREKKTAEPVLDVSLLINRRFIIPALTGFFIYGVKCYCCTAVPYYFTQGLHLPSTVSGSWLTVYFLSGFPLSLGLNRLNRRFTTRALAVFGAATWLVSMGMLVLSSADTPLWVFFLSAVISSVGIAILGGMPNACALKTVPAERSGAASGAISTISNLGAAMISAVLIPLLSVIDSRDGVPDYAASFPKTSLIMLGILAVCFFLSFFFPANKSSGIPETKECDGL